jgi:hypothetical protein
MIPSFCEELFAHHLQLFPKNPFALLAVRSQQIRHLAAYSRMLLVSDKPIFKSIGEDGFAIGKTVDYCQ